MRSNGVVFVSMPLWKSKCWCECGTEHDKWNEMCWHIEMNTAQNVRLNSFQTILQLLI